ncbi:MAG: ATPase, partial [Thermoanaerobaculia bacterium]
MPQAAPRGGARGPWHILWNQLKGGVIVVLSAATAVAFALGHTGDALAIGASVVFSVVFGFLTDSRAERALDALRTLSAPSARVLRGGLEREVPAGDLRPGDVVVLSAGH